MAGHAPEDETFMREALAEGATGVGLTSPNPPVGAVVVRDGAIIGRGWHHRAGEPHAEVEAIADAREHQGSDATTGATLYVTLEPCSTRGRTPPCVEAILEAGFSRVVIGTADPNPDHAGAAFDRLRQAGVEVAVPVLEAEAGELIRFFARRVTTGRPWVIAKSAATLDGRTTLTPGEGPWVSSEASREDVQRWRRQCDAILVGGETFRVDDPSLTLRGDSAEGRPQPLRVVLTSQDELPAGHRLFTDDHADRTRIHRHLSLRESLESLAEEGVNAVLLESGGRLLGHALAEGLVDEVVLYFAPRLGGGAARLLPEDGLVACLDDLRIDRIGPDVRIAGRVKRDGEA